MSRFNRLIANTNSLVRQFRISLSLDFGSNRTRIMINRELVWDQPTILAWHNRLQTVVAVGERAVALRGKTPDYIELISPIQKGVIAELDYAEYYLKVVLDQLHKQKILSPWAIVHCKVALPINASPLEKDQLCQVLDRVGLKVKKIVSGVEAVVSLTSFKKISQSHGIIDFGAETINMGIFIGSQLFKGVTLDSITDNSFTRAIIDQILVEYDLQIGWGVAQQIKHQLAGKLNFNSKNFPVMTVRGKDAQTQLVKVIRVEAKSFQTQFYSLANILLLDLKAIINDLPSEVITQLQEQGFYLTGGGSQLLDWQTLIKESWQMPAITSLTPKLDVVKGLADGK